MSRRLIEVALHLNRADGLAVDGGVLRGTATLSLEMGPHPLWQLEVILPALELEPGSRVLDIGCGRGATSVFLAREVREAGVLEAAPE